LFGGKRRPNWSFSIKQVCVITEVIAEVIRFHVEFGLFVIELLVNAGYFIEVDIVAMVVAPD